MIEDLILKKSAPNSEVKLPLVRNDTGKLPAGKGKREKIGGQESGAEKKRGKKRRRRSKGGRVGSRDDPALAI
jgi:hypothetical protein